MKAAIPYVAGFQSGIRRGLATPDELLVRLIFYGIILVVFAALWDSALAARGGEIEGYDLNSILWYVAGAEAVVVATKPRMIETIGDEIATGEVAGALLRPVSFVGFRGAVEAGGGLGGVAGRRPQAAGPGAPPPGP